MKVKIKDIHKNLDGDYDLDLTTLLNAEYHEIKKVSGVRAAELPEAVNATDIAVVVAFGKIVLMRAQHPPEVEDALWASPAGSIVLDFELPDDDDEDEEKKAVPLDPAPSETSDAKS